MSIEKVLLQNGVCIYKQVKNLHGNTHYSNMKIVRPRNLNLIMTANVNINYLRNEFYALSELVKENDNSQN